VLGLSDAGEALSVLESRDVDCIVSDDQMPEMDGLEFLRLVREGYPDLPFLLFTGRGSEELAGEAISAGVTDYLQKESGTEQFTVLANRIGNTAPRSGSRRRTAVSGASTSASPTQSSPRTRRSGTPTSTSGPRNCSSATGRTSTVRWSGRPFPPSREPSSRPRSGSR
jgi:CheY-like chemotaxis protein